MTENGSQDNLYRKAGMLAAFTIVYNIVEGIVSVWFGAADETLALFGFGVDSFVEVISGIGVWHMVMRLRRHGEEKRDSFEQQALRITGSAFYLLAAGLAITAILNIVQRHRPETTVWGIVISLVSISFMWVLIREKTAVGKALNSPAILADAACSKACLYLSVVLLAASAGFELTGIGSMDAAGAAIISWFAWKEGKEAFQKARGGNCGCSCSCSGSNG